MSNLKFKRTGRFIREKRLKKKLYLGKYDVYENGDIYSLRLINGNVNRLRKKPLKMKTRLSSTGYNCVNISHKNKVTTTFIHRLVAKLFVAGYKDGLFACHKDGNPTNNNATNLYWGTNKQNQQDRVRHGTDHRGEKSPVSKLKERDVKIILLLKNNLYSYDIAEHFGVCASTVESIFRGNTWSHVKLNKKRKAA